MISIRELGHIVLYVSDIERSCKFYEKILGFPLITRSDAMAVFSAGRTHHELLLIEVGGKPAAAQAVRPGLYHFGLKIGDTSKELKEAYAHLRAHKVTIVGTSDHGVTQSIYLLDPDNNEVELYVDVSDAWKRDASAIMRPPKPLRF